ncbi:PREDICTED: uncharacterized protein LOC109217411 [Nicotiana attenuata]|uniref:GRF-type domain-containing protein n=1 Tax=Nicotiana attenuata TaxID=49451 RepID=A0A1J6KTZ9_NICAT|nr:PREDICTED: uncharacterized protein LOC109217411 [Nicotiana attenuata]OIT22577.1 hypothetical protein A4A49_30545 [Nicotiana attenuata]
MSQNSQNSVYEEDLDLCCCGDYAKLKTSTTPANSGRRFYGCRISRKNGGCNYFRWFDDPCTGPSEREQLPSRAMLRLMSDRLRVKVKELEEERDKLKQKLKDAKVKMESLVVNCKEAEQQRHWARAKSKMLMFFLYFHVYSLDYGRVVPCSFMHG